MSGSGKSQVFHKQGTFALFIKYHGFSHLQMELEAKFFPLTKSAPHPNIAITTRFWRLRNRRI